MLREVAEHGLQYLTVVLQWQMARLDFMTIPNRFAVVHLYEA